MIIISYIISTREYSEVEGGLVSFIEEIIVDASKRGKSLIIVGSRLRQWVVNEVGRHKSKCLIVKKDNVYARNVYMRKGMDMVGKYRERMRMA